MWCLVGFWSTSNIATLYKAEFTALAHRKINTHWALEFVSPQNRMVLALAPGFERNNFAVRKALHVHPVLGAAIRALEDVIPAAWPVG